MKKYKILLVVYHPVGGIRTFFRYVYRHFDLLKYQFTLIAPEFPETHVLLEDLAALDLRYIPIRPGINTVGFFQVVTKVARKERFDLIHSHGLTSGICSIFVALLKRIPHIVTLHDVFTEKQFTGFRGFAKRATLGVLLSMVNGIHCVSYDARDNLLDYLKVLKLFRKKVTVILNGIEVQQFIDAKRRDLRKELGLSQNTFLIGFLGRFMSQKGFRYLVDALEIIKSGESLPKRPVILTFDEGNYIREEKEDVKRRGLGQSIFFLPFVANVASTLKGLDVVAIPSLWEACPLLPMEVMVAGVPLIGTNCVGLREVLRNTCAAVVPVRDSLALAEALIAEMSNPTTVRAREFAMLAAARFEVKRRAMELEALMLKHLER